MRDFTGIPTVPFVGQPYSSNIALCKVPGVDPKTVGIVIDWSLYGVGSSLPALGVNVNLQAGQAVSAPLDRIMSVKIDNTDSAIAVFVYFSDTADRVVCGPYAQVTVPVMTGLLGCTIYGIGFVTGQLPITRVQLFNILPPVVDNLIEKQFTFPQWKASPSIPRNGETIYTAGFGSPALGDQTLNVSYDLTTTNAVNLFATPRDFGQIIINSLYLTLLSLDNGSAVNRNLTFENTDGDILYNWLYRVTTTERDIPGYFQLQGGNVVIDATKEWELVNSAAVTLGLALLTISYTDDVTGDPNIQPGSQTITVSGNFIVPPYNQLAVEIWGPGGGGGTAGVNGGDGSGPSTFATLSAGAGQGGRAGTATGGAVSGGDVNTPGIDATGDSGMGAPNGGGNVPTQTNGTFPGGGGGNKFDRTGGASGGYVRRTYGPGDLTVGNSMAVVIGTGGAGANPGSGPAGNGRRGEFRVSWS